MIGISPAEFWDMEPRWFATRVKAYEDRIKYDFEITRTKTYLLCAYTGNMKKNMHPNRFWPSPFEKAPALEWRNVDPEILANFNRNADDTLAQMREQNNGVN